MILAPRTFLSEYFLEILEKRIGRRDFLSTAEKIENILKIGRSNSGELMDNIDNHKAYMPLYDTYNHEHK